MSGGGIDLSEELLISPKPCPHLFSLQFTGKLRKFPAESREPLYQRNAMQRPRGTMRQNRTSPAAKLPSRRAPKPTEHLCGKP